jgi:hypothetical protein
VWRAWTGSVTRFVAARAGFRHERERIARLLNLAAYGPAEGKSSRTQFNQGEGSLDQPTAAAP